MQSVGEKTYSQAVREGKYDLYVGNLFGKYDNVRTYWEDQLTRIALRPFLRELVERCRRENRGVRIVDLGCGAGQGYEILTKIDRRDLDLGLQHERVLPKEEIDLYLGLDISQAMVERGQVLFESQPEVTFAQADLREGFGPFKDREPFDIYFSSYGSLSHLNRQDLVKLLQDICEHSGNESLIVLDFLGRYSIEWPDFWFADSEDEKVRDYTMSYLYSEAVRKEVESDRFPLRFWVGSDVKDLSEELTQTCGLGVEVLKLMDRSMLVGRHTDTQEYNKQLKPIRRAVNSLHQDYLRTNLEELVIDPAIVPDHPVIAPPLRELIDSWNVVVEYCQQRLWERCSLTQLEGWDDFAKPLQFALMTIDRVIADVGWMWYGDPRANIIEPQLGYALRTLEYEMQRGRGCGHGLVAILKTQK
ncbi:class I SAM-dependent methyltransferase [Baaleninema sp.]|uniref:class I SAM-dependent methyltransferase n=1 Tax=Baaleninema sp. TaxID=3101197 RepID=UPI003D05AB30